MTALEMEAAIVRLNQRLEAVERELAERRDAPPPLPPPATSIRPMGAR